MSHYGEVRTLLTEIRDNATNPISGFITTIVNASGTSEKTVNVISNMLLTDIYIEAPAIVTNVSNDFKFEILTNRDNIVYGSGYLDATNASDHPIHLQRGIRGTSKYKITCDGNINMNETFIIETVGM